MALVPDRWGDTLLTAKQALWWRTVERRWYRANFSRHNSRDLLAATVTRVGGAGPLRVLEFGCNAGNNLHTLRSDAAVAIEYCGVDINPEAIASARRSFPADTFHAGDHRWFIQHAETLGSFDLFIASHVLYYVDEKHTRLILAAAGRAAKYVLVSDRMQRFAQARGERAGLFTHPYGRICGDIGLEVLEMDPGDEYGHFLARGRLTAD